MQAIETISLRGYTISIYQDEDAQSPAEWESADGCFPVASIRDFSPDNPLKIDPLDVREEDEDEEERTHYGDDYYIFALYAYVHSGVALSLGRGYPFDCQWDSGQAGWMFVHKSNATDVHSARRIAESTVETWNQYLSGDVYYYQIEDEDGADVGRGCGGLYGLDYAIEAAREEAEAEADARDAQALADRAADHDPRPVYLDPTCAYADSDGPES